MYIFTIYCRSIRIYLCHIALLYWGINQFSQTVEDNNNNILLQLIRASHHFKNTLLSHTREHDQKMPGCELWERMKHFNPEVWSLHLFSSVSSSPSRPSPCGNILKHFTQILSFCAQMVPALSLALVVEEKSPTHTVLQEKQASTACQCFVYTQYVL